jgi:hypothetical protein
MLLLVLLLSTSQAQLGVTDVQLSLTSLEEVFLTIARKAEIEAAAATGKQHVTADLPDDLGTIEVALGEETITHPDTGVTYEVKWAQDEAGRLVVLELVVMGQEGEMGGPGQGGRSSRSSTPMAR